MGEIRPWLLADFWCDLISCRLRSVGEEPCGVESYWSPVLHRTELPGTQMGPLVLIGRLPLFGGLTFEKNGHLGFRYILYIIYSIFYMIECTKNKQTSMHPLVDVYKWFIISPCIDGKSSPKGSTVVGPLSFMAYINGLRPRGGWSNHPLRYLGGSSSQRRPLPQDWRKPSTPRKDQWKMHCICLDAWPGRQNPYKNPRVFFVQSIYECIKIRSHLYVYKDSCEPIRMSWNVTSWRFQICFLCSLRMFGEMIQFDFCGFWWVETTN